MNAEEFAARRRDEFRRVDEELRASVITALRAYARGEAGWASGLVDDASVIWLEFFLDEAPNADPEGGYYTRFREALAKSLEETEQPDGILDENQITRVTKWLGTYTINNAAWSGTAARGGRAKRWTAMNDANVRETHRLVDGQIVDIGGTFDVGGFDLHFPGEPVGPPEIWMNCRCLLQPAAQRGEANVSATTFAMEDPEDIAVEPVDVEEEDLVPDELEDDEEEVTEVPVHGVLAPEGVATGDGRMFGVDSLTHRELPLPILYQEFTSEGHGGSARVGRIDEIFREGNEMRFRGAIVLTKDFSPRVIEGIIDGTVRGISVDVDDAEVEMPMPEEGDEEDVMNALFNPGQTVFSSARIAGVTIVAIPAFQEAYISLGHEFADELSDEDLTALAACGCEGGAAGLVVDGQVEGEDDNPDIELGYDVFKNYTTEERKRMAKAGTAMPDGSYPIADCEDLANAIQAIGRASDPEATKAHIRKRKSTLGCGEIDIPETWSADSQTFAPGTKDGPGWITHPIPTARIRRYWVRGVGAAKIKWGLPGDFNRCRRQLAKYIANPDWLAGACANMHKEALGIWPGQHRGHLSLTASADRQPAPIFNLVASASPHRVFESNAFARMEMEDPRVGLLMEGDRVFGYVAQWGVCHIGIDGLCTTPPQTQSDYWYYATGVVDTDEGPVHVGQITMDTGHASLKASAKVAAAHYDNTGAAVADIAVGEDAFGIWFSGLVRPNITDDQRHALKASGRLSGDWRLIGGNLELVAALAVNVPGFPIPRPMVASAAGVQTALVAAGIVSPQETAPIEPPAVTAAAPTPADIAGIVRASVEEYRHQEKRAQQAAPIRHALRTRRIDALRKKMGGK